MACLLNSFLKFNSSRGIDQPQTFGLLVIVSSLFIPLSTPFNWIQARCLAKMRNTARRVLKGTGLNFPKDIEHIRNRLHVTLLFLIPQNSMIVFSQPGEDWNKSPWPAQDRGWLIGRIFVQMFPVDHLGQPEGKHQIEETCSESIYVLWDKWIRGENSGKGRKKIGVGGSCWWETVAEKLIMKIWSR